MFTTSKRINLADVVSIKIDAFSKKRPNLEQVLITDARGKTTMLATGRKASEALKALVAAVESVIARTPTHSEEKSDGSQVR